MGAGLSLELCSFHNGQIRHTHIAHVRSGEYWVYDLPLLLVVVTCGCADIFLVSAQKRWVELTNSRYETFPKDTNVCSEVQMSP